MGFRSVGDLPEAALLQVLELGFRPVQLDPERLTRHCPLLPLPLGISLFEN